MPEHLLDSREVAGFLHVSRSFAYDLMRSGLLPTVHLGRSVRVHPRDLDKYVDYLRRPSVRRRSQTTINNVKSRRERASREHRKFRRQESSEKI